MTTPEAKDPGSSDHGDPEKGFTEGAPEDFEYEEHPAVASKNEEEKYRLAGRPPLKTVLILMIGPVISQITGALYGVINTIWVSRVVGETGIAAVGLEITFENMGRAFGYFLMVSASTQISALFGKNQEEEAAQVICDLMRCSLICGAIVPAILLPVHAPLFKWFGASEETTQMGFDYLMPLCAFSFLTCLNLACQGFLQAEGRTLLIGFIDLASLAVSVGAFSPLFLYVFHSGVRGTSIATVLADGIPGIILTILYFKGVFGIKPKLRQLCKPFSKHTWPALGVGVSQLFANLAMAIPGIPIRKLIRQASGDEAAYDLAMGGFNVLCRYSGIIGSICIAVTTGYVPPGAYAYAAEDYLRYLWLSWHSVWISFAWCCVTSILSLACPRQISMIFGSSEEFLAYSGPMLRDGNALGFVMFMRYCSQAMLQAMQMGVRAIIVSLMSNFVGCIAFSYLLYYTGKDNVVRLMWTYGLAYAFGFFFGIAMLAGPFLKVYRAGRKQHLQQLEQEKTVEPAVHEEHSSDEHDEHEEVKNLAEI